MRIRTYIVDIDKQKYERPLYKQYDNDIELKIKVVDNGKNVDLTQYNITAFFDNGTDILNKTCTVGTTQTDNNIVTTILDNNILKNHGFVKAEFKFYKDTIIVTSFTMLIEVEKSIDYNAALESQPQWDLLKDFQTQIDEAIAKMPKWQHGNTTPGAGQAGNEGDYYLAKDTGNVYKREGENWTNTTVNLRGPAGPAGPAGAAGPTGPKGDPGDNAPQWFINNVDVIGQAGAGANGDFHLNTTNGKLSSKEANVWGEKIDLVTNTELTTALQPINTWITEHKKRPYNVKDYGAIGDGAADDTAAFNSAITAANTAGGGRVYIPVGKYKVGVINSIPSNITIEGEGSGSILLPTGDNLFKVTGTVGNEIEFAQNKTINDTIIATKAAPGLIAKDMVLIKSQRDCLSNNAHEDWRLGYATPNAQGLYFGEFNRVVSVTGNNVTLASGLIFPDYNITADTVDTTKTRACSTIQKFTPIENVIFKNFRVEGNNMTNAAIRFTRAYNCMAENIDFYCSNNGIFIEHEESLKCIAKDCRMIYDVTTTFTGTDYFLRNAYKSVSSTLCGFENCYSENGSQPFDITYKTLSIPSIYCFVKNCYTKGATRTGMTSHGGAYAITVEGNMFVDNIMSGISIRTRSSIISNNRVSGMNSALDTIDTSNNNSYGIALYEAWARDCVIDGNSITGFRMGVGVIDGTDTEEQFKWVGAVISNNTINLCNIGFRVFRANTNNYAEETEISFVNNTIRNYAGTNGKFIHLEPYVSGVMINGNVSYGGTNVSAGIYGEGNNNHIHIDHNVIRGNGRSVTFGTTAATNPCGIYVGINNRFYGDVFLSANVSFFNSRHYGSFHPYQDNVGNIGYSDRRWNTVYAATGTISTSDSNYKKDIADETLGLDFVNKLRPVSYKFIQNESDRTHHGLIAQEVEEVINSLGINIKDFAALTKTEKEDGTFIYGMRYSELIPHLIKSIQELSNKIDKIQGPLKILN